MAFPVDSPHCLKALILGLSLRAFLDLTRSVSRQPKTLIIRSTAFDARLNTSPMTSTDGHSLLFSIVSNVSLSSLVQGPVRHLLWPRLCFNHASNFRC